MMPLNKTCKLEFVHDMDNFQSITNLLLQSRTLIVITGPTASGKTGLSLNLSDYIPIEIISADSRQIYKYMNIGTAKPDNEELAKVKHYFIDYLNPDIDYNAGKFGDEAEKIVNNIFQKGSIPVVVGGSGLYIKSLCEGLFEQKQEDALIEIREFLTSKLNEFGKDYMYSELMKVDSLAAELYKDKNPRRVIRALEHYYTYGSTITESRTNNRTKRGFNCIYFGINYDRERLYERINKRTELMWNLGLVDETKNILTMGYSKDLNSLNTVGYKETIAFLEGKLKESEAVDEIKKNTRRYAKRQITWFKKIDGLNWLDTQKIDVDRDGSKELLLRLKELL